MFFDEETSSVLHDNGFKGSLDSEDSEFCLLEEQESEKLLTGDNSPPLTPLDFNQDGGVYGRD